MSMSKLSGTNLSEEEILRIYGKRWDIEIFFKTCKSLLNLGFECHSLSYDALTAHVSLAFIRYMLLSLQQRNNSDERTISELFLLMIDELADITFGHALALGFQAFLIMVCVAIYATLVQNIAITDDVSSAVWTCIGYTVLLCFTLFKTSSLAKSVFNAH